MISPDRAWSRQSWRYPGKKLSDFRLQVINYATTLVAGGVSQNQPVNFGTGGIILGILAGAGPVAQTSLQTYRPGLDLFSMAVTYQADSRSIVGTSEALGSSVFGPFGDLFPALEMVMPQNSALLYNFTSLITGQSVLVTLAHHCLLPGAVG